MVALASVGSRLEMQTLRPLSRTPVLNPTFMRLPGAPYALVYVVNQGLKKFNFLLGQIP